MRLFFFFLPCYLLATAPSGFFAKFPNSYFVETGSCEGDGIKQALKAGFSEIHSIELSEHLYSFCKEKFAPYSNIHLWHGDSGYVLEEVISGLNQPITFWIDAHWSDGFTAKGETNTPILRELEVIANHPIKTHTLLVDDVRLFGTEEFDRIQLSEIIRKIYEINPRYMISFETGYSAGDILVAKVPKWL